MSAVPQTEIDRAPGSMPGAYPKAPPLPRDGVLRLSPLNRRRWQNFRANRRGYWSFWLFVALFALSATLTRRKRPI